MGGIVSIPVGDIVPLRLKLYDEASGLYVRAIMTNSSDAVLDTRNLTHVVSGLFQDSTYTMPNETIVSATYITFSDVGYTTVSDEYQCDIDTFIRVADLDDIIANQLAASGTIISEINENEVKIDLALSQLTQVLSDIVAMSGAIPSDVWTFADRTLTAISGLEVHIDDAAIEEIASGVWSFADRTLTGEFTLGDGSVVIDHNYGGTDALRAVDNLGRPVDNVIISAFLQSDYSASRTQSRYIKAQVSTNVNGRWDSPLNLDPAVYTLLFTRQNVVESNTIDITVT